MYVSSVKRIIQTSDKKWEKEKKKRKKCNHRISFLKAWNFTAIFAFWDKFVISDWQTNIDTHTRSWWNDTNNLGQSRFYDKPETQNITVVKRVSFATNGLFLKPTPTKMPTVIVVQQKPTKNACRLWIMSAKPPRTSWFPFHKALLTFRSQMIEFSICLFAIIVL